MSNATKSSWEQKRTEETKSVEELLRKEFEAVDAYRYNSASIRIRVIDSRFRGKSVDERDAMVEKHLSALPKDTQADIMTLLTFAPEEIENPEINFRSYFLNREFDDPTPSQL
jgi:hypothetical protein